MLEASGRRAGPAPLGGGDRGGSPRSPVAPVMGPIEGGRTEPAGLFGRILDALRGMDDPERQRRKLLREYARRVYRSRPRLYNPRSSVAEGALGELFHTYYRVLGPARILLRNAKLSAVLKTVSAERCLSNRQKEALVALREEALTAQARTLSAKEVAQAVRREFGVLVKGFDHKAVDRARRSYRAVLHLVDLVNFDYWGILRKFDARYPEADFLYTPRFLSLDREHVTDALKDFVEVIAPMDPGLDWSEALAILKDYRGMELISADGWGHLLRLTSDLRRSGILLAIIRLIDGDPQYAARPKPPQGKVIEVYVEAVRKQTESVLKRVLDNQRKANVEALARQAFGDIQLPRLANYGGALNDRILKKGLPGFAHTAALAYTKAYLLELHKTRVRELVDALLIRAAWKDVALSRSLSDTYRDMLAVLPDLIDLDRMLGDNQELGVKVKGALARVDRAKAQTQVQAAQVLEGIDRKVLGMVIRITQGCASLAQMLRVLVEDSGQAAPQLVLNWKDLKGSTPREDTRTLLMDVYRRLQAMAQVLRLTVSRPQDTSSTKTPEPSEAAPTTTTTTAPDTPT